MFSANDLYRILDSLDAIDATPPDDWLRPDGKMPAEPGLTNWLRMLFAEHYPDHLPAPAVHQTRYDIALVWSHVTIRLHDDHFGLLVFPGDPPVRIILDGERDRQIDPCADLEKWLKIVEDSDEP